MKYYIVLLTMLAIKTFPRRAQFKKSGSHILASIGVTTLSTGDLKGVIFSTEYTKYIKERASISVALAGTIDDGNRPLFFSDSTGNS